MPACLELGPQPTLPPLLSTPPVIAENKNALLIVFVFSCSVCGRLQKVGVIVDSITVGAAKNMRLKCLSLATSGYAFHPPTLRQALRLNEQETVLSAGQRARQRPTSQAGRVRELCTLRWRVEGERERDRGEERDRIIKTDWRRERKYFQVCVFFWEGENQTSRALGGLRSLKRCCKQYLLIFFEDLFTVARATAQPHFRGAAQFLTVSGVKLPYMRAAGVGVVFLQVPEPSPPPTLSALESVTVSSRHPQTLS